MLFFDNESRTLPGIILEVQQYMVKIKFQTPFSEEKVVSIPKNIISSKNSYTPNIEQKFTVPTWFLKRNRIIPLNDKQISY